MSFEKFNLIKPIQKALGQKGYNTPTPIQSRSIPLILKRKDLLGCAQTGTGKTAAFAIPIIQLLSAEKKDSYKKRTIRSLIITPTRELAIQIGENFTAYSAHTPLKNAVVFGGVKQRIQTSKLNAGVDILIATPGRLLDLMNQGYISLHNVELFVLDEADRMLDMGFINDINKIIRKLPAKRQSLFFSATMPKEIVKLASTILNKPVKVEVTPESSTVEKIDQTVYYVDKPNKKNLLVHLIKQQEIESALVFTRTKHGANKIAHILNRAKIESDAIHGDKSQNSRQRALKNFKAKKSRVLVATDIAARGIDIDELSHVFNFDLPNVPETYVHRIGRTGRAGMDGTAISFCDIEEKDFLRDINKLIGKTIPVIQNYSFKPEAEATVSEKKPVEKSAKEEIKGNEKGKTNFKSSRRRKRAPQKNNKKKVGREA